MVAEHLVDNCFIQHGTSCFDVLPLFRNVSRWSDPRTNFFTLRDFSTFPKCPPTAPLAPCLVPLAPLHSSASSRPPLPNPLLSPASPLLPSPVSPFLPRMPNSPFPPVVASFLPRRDPVFSHGGRQKSNTPRSKDYLFSTGDELLGGGGAGSACASAGSARVDDGSACPDAGDEVALDVEQRRSGGATELERRGDSGAPTHELNLKVECS